MKYWTPFYDFCRTYTLYVVLFFALVFLGIAYAVFYDENNFWFDIFKTFGFTMVSGGVFAVIVKSEQFSKIFQDELRKIIYGDEDLSKRKDLEEIWIKTTKALCNQRFKAISTKLHDAVKKYYLPINHDYYYKNHSVEIDIAFDPENSDYIVVTEETTTTIISDDIKPVCYMFSSKIPLVVGEEEKTSYELEIFKVNSIDYKSTEKLVVKKDAGNLHIRCDLELSGKRQYKILRKEKKRYNLKLNAYRHHNAIWLYENFSLDLTYPIGMNIEFLPIGVTNDFVITDKHKTELNRKKAVYNGLIFKKQGFILFLNKI